MIYILELQNLLKYIYDIKEFKILFDILVNKQTIKRIISYEEINDLLIEIDKVGNKNTKINNNEIVYKLTNNEWIYFRQKDNNIFEGYISISYTVYSFSIDINNMIQIIKKRIPIIPIDKINTIIELASLGKTKNQISSKLQISNETVYLVTFIYKSKIYEKFKEKFINMVLKNAKSTEIRTTLNISRKKYNYYLDNYSEEINQRIASKKLSEFANYNKNDFKTIDMCKNAVRQNGLLISKIPPEFINEDLCLLAVKQNGLSIKYVPEKFKKHNIILEAVKQDYRAISFIEIQNENELILFMKNNKDVFKHIPPQAKNKKLCFIALHLDIANIKYIPTSFIDESMCKYFLHIIKDKNKIIDNKQYWINTIINRLCVLNTGLDDKKEKNNLTNKNSSKNYGISHKEESYEDILNNIKYKNKNDLLQIENSQDKVYNLSLIKNNFEKKYIGFIGKISNINKNSQNLKIKTEYKNIYYVWSFRKDILEISLEFSNKDVDLTKYFDSIEKELKNNFKENLIVGQTKTKTIIYVSKVKYSLDWAINTMYDFISIMDSKLKLFYSNIEEDNISNTDEGINQETYDTDDIQEDINNYEEEIEDNNIEEEQEYIHLNIIDGQSTTVQLTRYERNPRNRTEAIKIHGTTCLACGFNFNEFYGEDLAKDFIEIHHIKPVSQGEYTVNPKTDLVPLCSNCHSMIHKEKNPPKTIEEIKNRYKREV